jgi:hypothetical protein
MTWEAKVTEAMCQLKAEGKDFREAWHEALLMHPPSGRFYGPRQTELIDTGSERAETMLEFLERACDDAWHLRRPALAHLPILMEAIGRDDSGYARKKSPGLTRKAA